MHFHKCLTILDELKSLALDNRSSSVSPLLLQELKNHRINYSLVPKPMGGQGLGYTEEYGVIKKSAKISPNFGWLVFQLIGNVPRVFSILGSSKSNDLAKTFGKDLVVAYDTNPHSIYFQDGPTSDVCRLYGTAKFGTLATVATHFGFVGRTEQKPEKKVFCLVERNKTNVKEDGFNIEVMPGTGTRSYEIRKGHTVPWREVHVLDAEGDTPFIKYFSHPRSPIKHLAWSMGCLEHLIEEIMAESPSRTLEAFLETNTAIELFLDKMDRQAPRGDVIDDLFPILPTIQTAVLSAYLKWHCENSSLYFSSETFRNSFGDVFIASMHTTMRANYTMLARSNCDELLRLVSEKLARISY